MRAPRIVSFAHVPLPNASHRRAEAEKVAATIVAPNGSYGNKPSITHCPNFYATNADDAAVRVAARRRCRAGAFVW